MVNIYVRIRAEKDEKEAEKESVSFTVGQCHENWEIFTPTDFDSHFLSFMFICILNYSLKQDVVLMSPVKLKKKITFCKFMELIKYLRECVTSFSTSIFS